MYLGFSLVLIVGIYNLLLNVRSEFRFLHPLQILLTLVINPFKVRYKMANYSEFNIY